MLKDYVRVEITKSGTENIKATMKTAMDVENAYYRSRMFSSDEYYRSGGGSGIGGSTPMETGNLIGQKKTRAQDFKNSARFRCHKVRCRS